jgi:phosphoribosylformylglycinamidine synthase subunit PurQ / glutaminase
VEAFVREEKPVIGICNGFQVLVELGLLPGTGHEVLPREPQAVLHVNDSAHYECRPVRLKHENRGRCVFTRDVPHGHVGVSIASHGEGKLLFPRDEQTRILKDLEDNDQIVYRYVDDAGERAGYPWNPNGAPGNVAGITNESGTVFGMMPHPERAFHGWQHPDWTRRGPAAADAPGDGRSVLEGVVKYVERKF